MIRGTRRNGPLPTVELVERYRAGAALDDLAILYKCSPPRVRRILVAAGVEIRPSGRRPTGVGPEACDNGFRAVRVPVDDLVGRYRAGAALDDLAILYKCSPPRVRRILRAAGVELRPRARRATASDKP